MSNWLQHLNKSRVRSLHSESGMDIYTLICIKWITNKNLLYKKINKIKKKKKRSLHSDLPRKMYGLVPKWAKPGERGGSLKSRGCSSRIWGAPCLPTSTRHPRFPPSLPPKRTGSSLHYLEMAAKKALSPEDSIHWWNGRPSESRQCPGDSDQTPGRWSAHSWHWHVTQPWHPRMLQFQLLDTFSLI